MKKTRSKSRSRRSFSVWAAALIVGLIASVGLAQTSPILTIDLDRLLSETQLGSETMARLEQQAQQLADENNRIETQLIEEEQRITDQRAELEAEAFRDLADDFDSRVQQFRSEQDAKARALTRSRDEARQDFFSEVTEIVSNIVREKGALVVIERREVFLSADTIDITDEAIQRVNEEATAPN